MSFIIGEVCVIMGIIVVWLFRGCKGDLDFETTGFEPGQFFKRREGVIGLVAILAIVGLCWLTHRLLFVR